MYILAILAVILSAIGMVAVSPMGIGGIVCYFDWISLLDLLIITIPILVSSGLGKDFNRAFGFALGGKKAESLFVLRRAKEAVELVRKTLLYAGGFASLFLAVLVLCETEDFSVLGAKLAIVILNLLYAVALNLLLLPISTRLEVKIEEYMQE